MKALVIANHFLESPQGERTPGQKLDQRIEELHQCELEPLVILGGWEAESILRSSQKLSQVELIFDTNEERSLLSGLRAGLRGVHKDSLIVPLYGTRISREIWQNLWQWSLQEATHRVFHLIHISCYSDQNSCVYPFLVTRTGKNFILDTPSIETLSDPRLEIGTLGPDVNDLSFKHNYL